MIARLLVSVCLWSAPPEAKTAPPPSSTLEPAGKVRLKRRDAAEKKKVEAKEDEDAPTTDSRPIPLPESKPKRSALDQKLVEDLGKGLEANKKADDPLAKIATGMRAVERRLAKADASKETLELQRDILSNLDALLKPPPGSPPPKNKQSKKDKKKEDTADKRQQKSSQRQQASKSNSRQPGERPGPPRSGAEVRGTVVENKDIWGHLSASLRHEMSQYAKDAFLEKYRDLLEQYYAAIAAQSQKRRGD